MPCNLVFDIETDGFDPSQIWTVGMYDLDTREYTDYVLDEVVVGLIRLSEADIVIGHNVRTYDVPVIKRLTKGMIEIDPEKVIDTLDMSRALFGKTMKSHKLETWGVLLESPKLEWKDFSRYDPRMRIYQEQDVRLNVKLYEFLAMVINEGLQPSI